MRLLTSACLIAGALCAQEPPVETLFDGKTLAGWKGDPAIWSVKDGWIVGSTVGQPITENTFLVLEGRQLANFFLCGDVQLEGSNNSGVQYRSRELPGGGFRVAGYQCDVNPAPGQLGKLYDERGAGILGPCGEFVRWTDAGRQHLGKLDYTWPVDLGRRQDFSIFAAGDLVWHSVGNEWTAAVQDQRSNAPRSGCIALQVHAGAPMTVRFKNLKLIDLGNDTASLLNDMPTQMKALLRRDELQARAPSGLVPQWVWDGAARADDERFFRRTFSLSEAPVSALLVITCDNHCRVWVNGEKAGASDEWESPLRIDVTRLLRAGDNVIAVHGANDGGRAGLAARLSWQIGGNEQSLVSDASWRCSDDDPDGWTGQPFDDSKWRPATRIADVGDTSVPWTRVLGASTFDSGGDPFAAQVAVLDTTVLADQPGNQVDVVRLLDVPRACGSWVSLCRDGKNRLYASAQGGGLYRVVPAPEIGELTTFERVPVELGGAHGLLWFRDALYAVVNGKQSGLYRLTDTNGDDALDRVELLQALDGEGEHGPHSVVTAPDGEHLLVVCGNQTKMPKLAASRVPTDWREDRLLPRLDDPNPYWEGHSPPGGWVAQCDADGKDWELLCCGFRNPYDLVVLPNGLVITIDSDMEWDLGLPWYRPTRLLAVHAGVDYGWRIGSAKWPDDYPDAPRALRDMGPGSPTGMAWLSRDLVDLDWTFGAIRLDCKPWLTGAPLPVADVAAGSSDASYVVTGGRGLPSALLWLKIIPCQAGAKPVYEPWGAPWPTDETATDASILERADTAPVASRIALERMPVAEWCEQALDVTPERPVRSLTGLLALARQGSAVDLQPVLDALGKLPFAPMSHADRIAWLRVHALALLRLGPANEEQRTAIGQRLLPLFPTGNERQDQDLAELLTFVEAPGALDKLVPALVPMRPSPPPAWAAFGTLVDVYGDQYAGVIEAMAKQMPPIGQLAIADALRTVKHGWTLEQRRAYFEFLAAARTRKGGASYDGYVAKIAAAAWSTCSPAEQEALADVAKKAFGDRPKFRATPPKGPGRDWQLADIDGILRDGLQTADPAAGRNLFHAASCASCHYFAGEGGNHGPDLTSLGNKFSARDVLEAILEPSKVTSEQYAGQVLTAKDGRTVFGFVRKTHHGDTEVFEVMPATAAAEVQRFEVADVQKVEPSPLSPMPADLVDGLSRDELRDLVAFLLSRGVKQEAPTRR